MTETEHPLPKPSDDHTRYRRARGRALFQEARHEPLNEIVEALPELATARQAWQDENAKGDELDAAERVAAKALDALSVPPQRTRAPGVPIDEYEVAQSAYAVAERATIAQSNRALAALKRFDDLTHDPATRAERIAVASAVAAAHHATAVAAWKTLREALDARDLAHTAAASPGRHWTARYRGKPYNDKHYAEAYYSGRVDGFDLGALTQEA
ncbi:hypothetical protein [Leifsonia sp. NPDC058248]|uniref:hypothetical protein n=1 Tax=Leifsonia sp. NPDC058248 TaxID=3346402 RepID=UPI0036DA8787